MIKVAFFLLVFGFSYLFSNQVIMYDYNQNPILKIDRIYYESLPYEFKQQYPDFEKTRTRLIKEGEKRGEEPFFAFTPKKSINTKFQYFICQNLPFSEQQRCIEKFNHDRISMSQSELHQYFFSENYNIFLLAFMNIPMYYWSDNNFKQAKKYLDNIDFILNINKLHKFKSSSQIMYSYKTLRAVQGTYESDRWFFTHRYIRFIENILRTKHSYLCTNKDCINKAWNISQKAISNNFIENMVSAYFSSLSNAYEVEQLFMTQEILKVQKGLLILADRAGVFQDTKKWQDIFTKKINNIEQTLSNHKYIEILRKNLTLQETKNMLSNNETIVSYIYSMGCREPLVWEISQTRTVFKKTGKYGCTSGKLREKVALARNSLKLSKNRNEIIHNQELIYLRKILIDSLNLPVEGSKLYFIVDETISGVPFELLPMKSGKLLGEMYQISYLPSISILNNLKRRANNNYKFFYIGLAKDQHKNINGFNDLHVNKISKKIQENYKKSLVLEEPNESDIYKTLAFSNSKYVQFLTHSIHRDGYKQILLYGVDSQNDGDLTDVEILQNVKGITDTIFLTSCDSIASHREYVGEAFSPLSQSIFSALKAKRMIATRWDVQDKVIESFMGIYFSFREKQGLSSIEAYQRTINKLKEFYPTKPIVWASFMHIGI